MCVYAIPESARHLVTFDSARSAKVCFHGGARLCDRKQPGRVLYIYRNKSYKYTLYSRLVSVGVVSLSRTCRVLAARAERPPRERLLSGAGIARGNRSDSRGQSAPDGGSPAGGEERGPPVGGRGSDRQRPPSLVIPIGALLSSSPSVPRSRRSLPRYTCRSRERETLRTRIYRTPARVSWTTR